MGTLIKGMTTTHDKLQGASCRPVLVLADEAGRTAIPTSQMTRQQSDPRDCPLDFSAGSLPA